MSNKNLITVWYVPNISNSVNKHCRDLNGRYPHPTEVKYDESYQETHIVSVNPTYETLCGLDGNDPNVGQFPSKEQFNEVTCEDCIRIWKKCREVPKRFIRG